MQENNKFNKEMQKDDPSFQGSLMTAKIKKDQGEKTKVGNKEMRTFGTNVNMDESSSDGDSGEEHEVDVTTPRPTGDLAKEFDFTTARDALDVEQDFLDDMKTQADCMGVLS